jgi:hypothetical protein
MRCVQLGGIPGQSPKLERRCYGSRTQWILNEPFFLFFSTIKFMFERSDLGPNFLNHIYASRHYLTSRRIIFWNPMPLARKT